MRRKPMKKITQNLEEAEDLSCQIQKGHREWCEPSLEGTLVSERVLENVNESSEPSFLVELLLLLPRPHARSILYGIMGRMDAVEREALRTKLFVHFMKWGKGR